jgi:hypothetical protein
MGKLVKETANFYVFDEWCGGDVFQGRKRVAKPREGYWSPHHLEPCPSCKDHPKTQYPHGYMD